MRPEAQAWWELAEADLQSARVNLSTERFYVGAFFAQQAAEKGLKAVWIHRRRELAPMSALSRFETQLLRLNPLYVSTRYPDAANGPPPRNYNREITQGLIRDAEEVIAWCRSELGLS